MPEAFWLEQRQSYIEQKKNGVEPRLKQYSQDIKNSYYDTEQFAGKQMHTNTENRSEEVQGSHTSANGLYQTAKQLIRLLMEL